MGRRWCDDLDAACTKLPGSTRELSEPRDARDRQPDGHHRDHDYGCRPASVVAEAGHAEPVRRAEVQEVDRVVGKHERGE
jgi:hypothetical protein